MARIVLCSPPLRGHVTPIVEIGRQFTMAGHEVVMITGSRFENMVSHAGIEHVALAGDADFDERLPLSFTPDIDHLTGMALSRHQVIGTFVRPIPEQASALNRVLAGHRPVDVIYADATFAGVIPLLGQPEDQRPRVVGVGTLPLAQSSVDVPPYNSGLPVTSGVFAQLRNRIANTTAQRILFRSVQRHAAQLVHTAGGSLSFPLLDLSRAFDAFVQLSPREFEYPRSDLSANVVFAGPILPSSGSSIDVAPPHWWTPAADDARPLVHVTQGTLDNHDFTQLITPALRALADLPVTVVVSTGGAPVTAIGAPIPTNAIVVDDVDYRWLLPRTALLITNGGFGTVQQALAHRAAVIVAPGGEDKREVAARVGYFGVGIDLRVRRPTPAQIRSAIDALLASHTIADAVDTLADATALYDPIAVLTDAGHLRGPTPPHRIPTTDEPAPTVTETTKRFNR